MYAWIWRHLPFGRPGRIVGSVLLVAATLAMLWYGVFPRIESYMPWNDGQITNTGGGGDNVGPTGGPGAPADPESPPPAGVIPYDEHSNNPEPSSRPPARPAPGPSRKR